jgi:putative tricarboxylic transport membrane protein
VREENLRRALSPATRPLSAVLIAAAAWLLVLSVLPKLRRKRDEVFVEG